MVTDLLHDQLDHFERILVSPGPEAIRALSQLGGILITFYGIYRAFRIDDILFDPVLYIVGIAQILFGYMTFVLEASTGFCEQFSFAANWQAKFHEYAKFLTLLWGRGAFYVYVGSHIIYIRAGIYGLILGIYVIAMGVFYIMAHFNIDLSKPLAPVIVKIAGLVGKIRNCLPGRKKSR